MQVTTAPKAGIRNKHEIHSKTFENNDFFPFWALNNN
jgi:hypothetical protein